MADEKPKIPTKKFHFWQIGLLVILSAMMIWSSFIKPTTTNRIGSGGTLINNYDIPKIPLIGGGCMRLKADIYWQVDPKSVGPGHKKDEK